MSDQTLDPSPAPDSGRLTGWKEIAAYLGRGVRTAQRWEREFGMPVRRIGTNRAESVFAFVEEIDDWLTSASAASAKGERVSDAPDPDRALAELAESESAPQDPSPAASNPAPSRIPVRMKALVWVLGSLTVLLAAIGIWRESSPRTTPLLAPCVPSSWTVTVDTLTVRDDGGRTCWSHRFPALLRVSEYERPGPTAPAGIEDLDGDGNRETWFIVHPERREDAKQSGFFLFDRNGQPRWAYRFEGTVRFGESTYPGPWAAHRLFVTERPEGGGGRAIWAVSRDQTEYPAVLQRLDPASGAPQSAYWSNGYIEALTLTPWKGRPVLLAGAAFNARVAPSVAIIDAANPNGSTPAEQLKYRCTSCAPGEPLALVVFPKPARFRGYAVSGSVHRIDPGTAPVFATVTATHGGLGGMDIAGVYRLDNDLFPLRADAGDGYLATYEQMVRAGRITPVEAGVLDPARELLPLLHWRDGRFVEAGKR
jgi:hypothetical protein